MEGRIGPDNDTLVSFLDIDGDPNEGHNDETTTPQLEKQVKPLAAEGEGVGPETVIDMSDPPPEGTPPTDEPTPAEEEKPEEQEPEEEKEEQAAAPETPEKKKTPWQRTNELRRELAEQKRLNEEAAQRALVAERALQDLQQRQQQIETYLQSQAANAQKAAQQKEPEIPPYEENPLENLRGNLSLTQQIIKEANERQRQLEQQSVLQQFEGRIEREEAVYVQKNPHYYEARDFLIDMAQKEFKAAKMTDQQIADTMQAYRVQFARAAWTEGKPIAEIVEQVAMARGYKPANGAVEPEQLKMDSPREKVQRAAARDQQASASLARVSQTNGRPPAKLTREQVLRMSEDEMDRMDQENPGWMERYMSQQ